MSLIFDRLFSLLNYIISFNFYLAFGIALTGFSFALLIGNKPDIILFLIIFLITFSLYSINRLTDKAEDAVNNPVRVSIISKYENQLLFLAILAYLIALALSFLINIACFLALIFILLIGVVYSVKSNSLKRIIGLARLKDLFIGKNVVIAINWVLAMVFIPLLFYSGQLTIGVIILAVFIIIRSIINTVLFDLGDIEGDKKQKIVTIPIILGKRRTILLFYLLNTFLVILVSLAAYIGFLPRLAYLLNISSLFVYFYLFLLSYTKINQRKLLDFVVDGEYIIIGGSILLFYYFVMV